MSKPRIACFHGGGSNSSVYAIQCSRLQAQIDDILEFVYFEAPFERGAGPGILPFFAEYAPFKSWFEADVNGVELADGSGFDDHWTSGIDRVQSLMKEKSQGGEWVGAMGFSQGSRVVGGLLLDQQLREDAGLPKQFDFKFGMLCMGSRAPMEPLLQRSSKSEEKDNNEITRIRTPTLHLHGLKDGQLQPGRHQLATYYDQTRSNVMEIDYHHAMPWNRADLTGFADRIRHMYEDAR